MNRCICVGVVAILLLGGMSLAQTGANDPNELPMAVADGGLVGWWTFEDVDSGVATDASGWEHHGFLMGNPQRVPGYRGRGIQFDGLDDYVATGYAEDLARWTVCVWVKSPAAPAWDLESGPVHRESNYQLNWNHRNDRFRGAAGVRMGDLWYPASFGPLFGDRWYHLAATFDGTALNAYVDGVLITSNPEAQGIPRSEPGTLTFGKHAQAEFFFAGTIDDVQIYNRALTLAEIATIARVAHYVTASNPQPAHGAGVDIREAVALSWWATESAVMHDIYLGMDEDTVAAADPNSPWYRGRRFETIFPLLEEVEFGGRYFWRIDEVEADGTTIHPGPVWTFTVPAHIALEDFESYTDQQGERIHETWGCSHINPRSARAGNPVGPFAERNIVQQGEQSMAFCYDNTSAPFYSEVGHTFLLAQDWTIYDVDTLSLWFRGNPPPFGQVAPGVFTMSAVGADIWGVADECCYAYRQLTGDGAIVARIDGIENTAPWAKAGVMIRRSLEPGSAYAFALVTPDGRRAFQNRPIDNMALCYSAHSTPDAVDLPHWVKLEREGNRFTACHSADGINWVRQEMAEDDDWLDSPNPQTIDMEADVYIGLALTSHDRRASTTACFSNVVLSGRVSQQWRVAEIGLAQPVNSPDSLYVVLEDADGRTSVVSHPDPAAANATAWTEWRIPLSRFGPLRLEKIENVSIGAGSRAALVPTGVGWIYIDDIGLLNSQLGL